MKVLETLIIEFDLETHQYTQLNPDTFILDVNNLNKLYWVHFNLNDYESIRHLVDHLGLSNVISEVTDQEGTLSSLSDTDNSVTMQLQCLQSSELDKNSVPRFTKLLIHLTNNYCLTVASEPIAALVQFLEYSKKSFRFGKTPCFILFLILDSVVNDYATALIHLDEVVEQMDIDIHVNKNIYQDVMSIKQHVMRIKRNFTMIREMLMRISTRKISVISEACSASLANLANHTHLISHESDSIRDVLNGLLDQIDNLMIQRMNETMKVLTAFAAIFLPLSLIAGIYGMNFRWIPELEWKYGYFGALFVMFICAIILLTIFKKKDWF